MDHPLGYAITYTDQDLIRDLAELAVALGKGNSAKGHAVLQTAISRIEQLSRDVDARVTNASNQFLAEALLEASGRLEAIAK